MLESIKPYESEMPILDVSEVIALEKRTAESGTSLLTLMGRAGGAVAQAACKVVDEDGSEGKQVVILAGSGNNGGDGWVAASSLAADGYDVTLVSKMPAEELKAEPARTAAREAMRKGGFEVALSPAGEELRELLNGANIIIDAILGTGFAHSEVRPPYSEWIELANAACNAYGIPILAVDCPSGLNAQTGEAAMSCIKADETITMIAPKTGLVQEVAGKYVGTLLIAPIGIEVQASGSS